MNLSVALAVFNEKANIKNCLESVKGLADEIVVVDGSSTDKTAEIARKEGARVITEKNRKNFHINKQIAIDACKGDWILQLDADERVSPALAREIRELVQEGRVSTKLDSDTKRHRLFNRHQKLIEKRDKITYEQTGQVTAYYIPRKNYFLNRPLLHGGVYPDGVVRLGKKGAITISLHDVHGQMNIKGGVGWLNNDLLHFADPTFSRYLTRSNRYTTLQAEQWLKENKLGTGPLTVLNYFTLKPTLRFLELYLRHKGFMDGFPGFVFAVYSGLHLTTSYVKYWEKRKTNDRINLEADWE